VLRVTRRWCCRRVAWTLILLQLILVAYSAWVHSPTLTEVAYLPAGISHWQLGRFELASVSPPLVRLCAAIPAIVIGDPITDWSSFPHGTGSRPEWTAAPQFVELNGPRTFWLFTLGRWGCLPFAAMGAVVCWRWACEAYGELAGLIAVWLWCLCPNILGHAALLTPDVGGAAAGALAGYLYWRWLQKPGGWRAVWAGAGLGLALLSRTTWIILIPLWIVMCVVRMRSPSVKNTLHVHRSKWGIFGVLAIALYIVNLGYAFSGSFESLEHYVFVSKTLNGIWETTTKNQFVGSWIGKFPVPVPRDFLLGMDLQRRDFEEARWSYLAGQGKYGGWWYYYLYGLAVKLSVGVLGLFGLAIILSTRRQYRREWYTEALLLVPIALVLLTVSSQMSFSHHVRYVYSMLPFFYIWISKVAQVFSSDRRGVTIIAASLLVLHGASSLAVYPHSLSYFNELAGGPNNGHRHLINSNLDWGQDLLLLQHWCQEHPAAKPFFLAYFGGVDPAAAGIGFDLPIMRDDLPRGLPFSRALAPGWYAVSATLLYGHPYNFATTGRRSDAIPEAFSYFKDFEPVDQVGYSILIYHLKGNVER